MDANSFFLWARSNGIPAGDREGIGETAFRLYAEMHYRDGSVDEPVYADFSSAPTEWQYTSLEIAKGERKPADFVLVGCEYSHNFGSAYFDGLTLVRTGIETGLTADDFAEYDEDEAAETTTYDAELVSDAETEETAPEFEELTDSFGNALTETTASDGEFGTVYRAFEYNANGIRTSKTINGIKHTYTLDGAKILREAWGNNTLVPLYDNEDAVCCIDKTRNLLNRFAVE